MRDLRRFGLATLLLGAAGLFSGHDLFLRPRTFVVPPQRDVAIAVVNGTFARSDGAVARDRVRALELAGPDGRRPLPTAGWRPEGDSARFVARFPAPGSYVVGVVLHPRTITLSAGDFERYLREEGLDAIRQERQRQGVAGRPARERYTKHAKTIVQVGAARTENVRERLGHAAELVPLDHPYRLRVGQTLRLQAWALGRPAAGVTVIAGGRRWNGQALPVQRLRADAQGVVALRLRAPGLWYAKFIAMRPLPADSGVDYASEWATLTFAVVR